MFYWRQRQEPEAGRYGVEWAFTDRHGGVSQGHYGSLNLGAGVADDPAAVAENRSRVARSLGLAPAKLRFMSQQHGCDVHTVHPGQEHSGSPDVDGIVARGTSQGVAALVADCTPVLLVDRSVGLVAAAHAGRPGMMAGVVPATVQRLRDLGAVSLEAIVGPSICGRCYEVPLRMREAAGAVSPVTPAVTWTGTPAIDVAAGVVDQLTELSVPCSWVPGCARESEDLYSYRGEGQTGRYAGVVRLLPPLGGEAA
ncbi:polyphenol oxidase family protein [Ornithinimicrobium sp. INDO-MA30-4]|nr:polyphenol oxidase family protein [Ornithinimicrobium sp. INDO-MA30-4]